MKKEERKKIVRHTKLTLGELIIEINNQNSQYPECFFINEIGMMCYMGDKQAEVFMRHLLNDDKTDEEKFIAFCHLASMPHTKLDRETALKLNEFSRNSKNKEIIEKAEGSIENFNENIKPKIGDN